MRPPGADHNGAMTNTPHRTHIPALLAVVTLAAILRAGVAAPNACISRDGVWFVEMAKKLADDPVRHMRIETKQPGLSWVMLATHKALGGADTPESWQATGKLIAGVGGVAVCALVCLLALRLFDPTTAIVAGIFVAFWPHGMQLSADVLSDMPHLALYLAALGILASGEKPLAIWRWPLAGAIAGLAYWFRLEAVGFLPAVGVWALISAPRTERLKAVGRVALVGIGFAVVAGPFILLARTPATWVQRASVRSTDNRAITGPARNGDATTGQFVANADDMSVSASRPPSIRASEPPQSCGGHDARNASDNAETSQTLTAALRRLAIHSTGNRAITGPARNGGATTGQFVANADDMSVSASRPPSIRASEPPQSCGGHDARNASDNAETSQTLTAALRRLAIHSTDNRAITGPARNGDVIAGHEFANAVGPLKLPQRMAEEWARSGRYVFAALFLAGLLIRSTPGAARPLATLCALIAIFQLLLVAARVLKYGELSSRYMLTAIALTIPWAAAGFVHLIRLAVVRSKNPSHRKAMFIWATGWVLALAPMVVYGFRPINAGRLTLREAGCWLRETAAPDDVILADDLNLSQAQYYADRIYPDAARWDRLARNAGDAARLEAIRRIRPAWFITMIDEPKERPNARAYAEKLARGLSGYDIARVFDDDARPVIVFRRVD